MARSPYEFIEYSFFILNTVPRYWYVNVLHVLRQIKGISFLFFKVFSLPKLQEFNKKPLFIYLAIKIARIFKILI